MKLSLIAAAFMLAGQAAATDRPINEEITLRNLDRAFEMAAAKLGLTTVIYENECFDKKPASCSFHGQGKLEIRGIAADLDSPPSNISILYEPDGDPNPFVMNVGLLVAIAEPAMSEEQRAKIITKIIQAAAGKIKENAFDGENADFSAIRIGDLITVVTERSTR